MPGGDRTGPLGRGSMTGRGLGFCSGSTTPGYTNPSYGRGFGRGFRRGYWGRGRSFWWRDYKPEPYYPTAQTKEDEKIYLENMIKSLEEDINAIKERIKDLSKEKKETQ